MKRADAFSAALFLVVASIDVATAATSDDGTITAAALKDACKINGVSPELCAKLLAGTTTQKSAKISFAPPPPTAKFAKPWTLPTISNSAILAKDVKSWGCRAADQALFVRSDPLDNFNYLVLSSGQPSSSKAKGLSVNYTDNMLAKTQAATIDGRISYLVFGIQDCSFGASQYVLTDPNTNKPNIITDPITHQTIVETQPDYNSPHIAGLGFAPFISSNGSWSEPVTTTSTTTTSKKTAAGTTTTTTSNGVTTTIIVQNNNGTTTTITKKLSLSALRFGADLQAYALTPSWPIQQHFLYVSPYYQTDYRGLAQIEGLDVVYEPTIRGLTINDGYIDENISYITQFSTTAELTHVYNTGLTQLGKGQHAWIGETARPNLTFFPSEYDDPWFNAWIAGRISLIGSQNFFWDTETGKTATYYSAVLQYKLGDCTVNKQNPDIACSVAGSSAISFEYDWGRNKDTNVKANQILAKLSFAY